jgi:hypothetical protein
MDYLKASSNNLALRNYMWQTTSMNDPWLTSLITSLEEASKIFQAKSEAQADPVKTATLTQASDTENTKDYKQDYTKPTYYKHPDPLTYAFTHNLGPCETLCLKYITRWRKKDGIKDLRKARECLNRLINHEANLKRGN